MGYRFEADTGYLMPTNFGPSMAQDEICFTDYSGYSISYLSEKDAIAALLPESYEPIDEPVVTVSCGVTKGLNVLAGNGYNLVTVVLPAVFNGKSDQITGGYPLVMWENDTMCCILGRELFGVHKVYADIPDPWIQGDDRSFYCSEYGTKLVQAEIGSVTPVEGAKLNRMRAAASNGYQMGWKYIPRADWKGADLSIPVAVPTQSTIDEAWFGEGSVQFLEPAWKEAPISSHIMRALSTLVVKEYKPAVVTRGSGKLLVTQAKNLQ